MYWPFARWSELNHPQPLVTSNRWFPALQAWGSYAVCSVRLRWGLMIRIHSSWDSAWAIKPAKGLDAPSASPAWSSKQEAGTPNQDTSSKTRIFTIMHVSGTSFGPSCDVESMVLWALRRMSLCTRPARQQVLTSGHLCTVHETARQTFSCSSERGNAVDLAVAQV